MIKETTKAEKEFSALQLRHKWWFYNLLMWICAIKKKKKENTEKKVG